MSNVGVFITYGGDKSKSVPCVRERDHGQKSRDHHESRVTEGVPIPPIVKKGTAFDKPSLKNVHVPTERNIIPQNKRKTHCANFLETTNLNEHGTKKRKQ